MIQTQQEAQKNTKIQSYPALNQLGLSHDDEITYQSKRFEHYIDKIRIPLR
jgi:glutamyl/glutaminyl-tRNA synthetase